MNKKLAIAMGAALAGMSSVAVADSHGSSVSISGNVALTSDYVFRGISQTDNDPAIQGGFDLEHTSGFYAGTWASNVDEDFYEGTTMEWDFYGGWAGDVGPVGMDVGLNYFYYPAVDDDDANTLEGWVSISKDFEKFSLSGGIYYSDDWYGTDESWYVDLGAEIPVGNFTIAAHYGMSDYDELDDYDDWSIGVSTEAMGLGFDLTYTDTDVDDDDDDAAAAEYQADGRVVFTISKSL